MVLVASVVPTQPAWPQVAYLSMTRQTPKCALLPLWADAGVTNAVMVDSLC